MNKEELAKELKEVGASDQEIKEGILLVEKLSDFSHLKRSDAFKKSFLKKFKEKEQKKVFWYPRIFVPALVLMILLLIGFTTVVNAQKSNPGDFLYPVKRLSEELVSKVKPDFTNEILLRRSQEIKKLTEDKKDLNLIKSTVKEYKEEFKEANKKDDKKVEESRKNLKEAKEKSSLDDKKEIESALKQSEIKEVKSEEDDKREVKGEKVEEKKEHSD